MVLAHRRMPCSFTATLCITQVSVVATTMLRARAKGLFSDDYTTRLDMAECSCSCCIVEGRRPAEIHGNVTTKCSMPPMNDKRHEIYRCPTQCSLVNDQVIGTAQILHFERYCFYHCQPSSDASPDKKIANMIQNNPDAAFNGGSILDSTCVPMPKTMMQHAATSDQSGQDVEPPAMNSSLTQNSTAPKKKKLFG
eukprot:gnl/MRDRNA2_/MRDRNA2_94732_c0_seq1.p1 gnl/MRDRNA2_/MRDRNA2_94732_c0~~gnl/MRDRNA2_/MRDRNA2_94732_c0_seq1.p1  ORF type:complete len:195 (+),score=22.76 gnl/MRDRNA2_/MRDRNA2_94732_c0_seq1:91-675(+)